MFRTVLVGVLICWGVGAYSAYFVVGQTEELKITDHHKLYGELVQRGRFLEAADQFIDIQRIRPAAIPLDRRLIKILNQDLQTVAQNSDYNTALSILERLRELQPDSADYYYNTACIYSRMGKGEEAVLWLDQAVKKGFRDWKLMRNDPDLTNIRNTQFMRAILNAGK